MIDQYGSDESIINRHSVVDNLYRYDISIETAEKDLVPPLKNLSEDDEKKARHIAIVYDRVGFALSMDQAFEEDMIKWHADAITEVWLRVWPYLKYKWRKEEGLSGKPEYMNQLQRLGEKARKKRTV